MKTRSTTNRKVVQVDARTLADIIQQVFREEFQNLKWAPQADPPKLPPEKPPVILCEEPDPNKNNEPEEKNEPEVFVNVNEGARILQISKQTLYSYTSRSVVPFYKKAKRIYFKKSELLKWLHSGRNKSLEEIEREAGNRNGSKKKGGTE